jgi:hypothetical protein
MRNMNTFSLKKLKVNKSLERPTGIKRKIIYKLILSE